MDDENNVVLFTDDHGNEIEFEFLDLIDYGGAQYAVLLSTEEGADEALIMRLAPDENGNEIYVCVEDEAVINAVFDIFKKTHGSDFNFFD
jgi:uncharacterized protein YrzB (UPF0473 family)